MAPLSFLRWLGFRITNETEEERTALENISKGCVKSHNLTPRVYAQLLTDKFIKQDYL
jgi:hypothetical protein